MSDEPKKDLTNLMDFAKSMQDSGQIPDPPAGSVMEEQKIDKVDDFASLEDFSKANPSAAPSESEFITTPPPEGDGPSLLASIPGLEPPPPPLPEGAAIPDGAFQESPEQASSSGVGALPAQMIVSSEATFSPGGQDLSAMQLAAQTQGQAPTDTPQEAPFELAPPPLPSLESQPPSIESLPAPPELPIMPPPLDAHLPQGTRVIAPPPLEDAPLQEFQSVNGSPTFSSVSFAEGGKSRAKPAEEALIEEPLRPARKITPPPLQPLDKVKQYSEQLAPPLDTVQAAYPFSLIITGQLAPEEKERLLDILARENMGIREMDLEPQFAEGKILIPRISEYAGVLIVSALRSTRAKIRLGPSDNVYATVDTRDSTEAAVDAHEHQTEAYTTDSVHAAEELPITTESTLPNRLQIALVDIVTASAALKTMVVQAESSLEYQRLLEALQRELKYKAYAKGATAITHFTVQLTQLHMPMHYRVLVTGNAIRTH